MFTSVVSFSLGLIKISSSCENYFFFYLSFCWWPLLRKKSCTGHSLNMAKRKTSRDDRHRGKSLRTGPRAQWGQRGLCRRTAAPTGGKSPGGARSDVQGREVLRILCWDRVTGRGQGLLEGGLVRGTTGPSSSPAVWSALVSVLLPETGENPQTPLC